MTDGELIAAALEGLSDSLSAVIAQAYTDLAASINAQLSGMAATGFTVVILLAILVCALWKRHVFLDIIGGLAWIFYGIAEAFDTTSLAGVMHGIIPMLVGLFLFIRVMEDTGKKSVEI